MKLRYIGKMKRSYLGKNYPNSDHEKNIVELKESILAETFLRMKIGKARLWEEIKEPKKKAKLIPKEPIIKDGDN